MNARQAPLTLKRLLTAMIILAVGGVIVFSSAIGNGQTTGTNETATKPSPVKSSEIESGKANSRTPDSDANILSGKSAPQETSNELTAPVRQERTLSIGIRKVYAPESQALQWPLGNKKYTYINAEKFESTYKLWKEFLSNASSDLHSAESTSDVFIESARYYGTMSESGDLSGWGEWKVRELTLNNESLAVEKQEAGNNDSRPLLIPIPLKILLTDFAFYGASEIKDDLENIDQNGDSSSSSSDSRHSISSASFPDGQTALFIPSEGVIRFRWRARRLEQNDFQIQSFGSVESRWIIDVPSDKKLTLRSDSLESGAKPLCASVTKEENEQSGSWRYSIRWTESETAVVHIGPANEKDRFDRFYKQQTTYTFSPYSLKTQCSVTFEPDSRTTLPQEIPFTVDHDSRVVWEAMLDGQPAELHLTETGYSVSLKKCKTDNPRPELVITSRCPLAEVQRVPVPEGQQENASKPDFYKLSLPRIELQSGRWQSGTAVVYTLQSPLSIETDNCSVVESKRDASDRYQTVIEQESSAADVVVTIEPFKELFFARTLTVVQWDGSQASFISTIELKAEEGRLYSLTAELPEGLTIDQATSEEQPDIIEDWEVYSDTDNPSKRTLTIYLHKSLCPERSLKLNIRSHAIADWGKPIELIRLAPIVFDRFESSAQILFVNVALNQRFTVGERVLYSPEQGTRDAGASGETAVPELPRGIECSPHTSPANGTGTGRLDAYEFCINLKMWGNCLATLEPVQSDYAVDAKTTIWVDKNSMEEKIKLAFSGERSHLSQFRFSYGQSSDASCAWQGTLVWSNNRYKVKVEPVEGNVYSIEIPRNVSSPFTVSLSRKIDWNQQRAFEALGSNDCSRLTSTVSVFSRSPRLFDIHAYGMKFVKSASDNNADFTVGTYEYDLRSESASDSPADDNASEPPRIELSVCKAPQSDVSIWAWNQLVEERHFASGNVLTSAQWTIENRFPAQDAVQVSDSSNTRLKITLPSDASDSSGSRPFLTGVRIDNESVSGENIIKESENTFVILLPPKKKLFVLTVQWTCFEKPLKTGASFRPQKPVLNIDVLQTSWNLYYPTSYRRLNSFLSSDPTVDGWLERIFGPLLRRDSVVIMSIVSQIWDDDQVGANQDAKNKPSDNIESELKNQSASVNSKADSNSTFPVPYTLSGHAAWNCCQFEGRDAPKIIRIIRGEVSECIRWTFFILTVSAILTLYFKLSGKSSVKNEQEESSSQIALERSHSSKLEQDILNNETEKQDVSHGSFLENSRVKLEQLIRLGNETISKSSWGFRRWICVFGGVCLVLSQALPWFLSLPFSGALLGTIICLLVLAVPPKGDQFNNGDDSNSASRGMSALSLSTRVTHLVSRLFILVFLLTLPPVLGQSPVMPPTDSRFVGPGASERRDYEIFIPVDQQNRPKSGYYVPQELLDLMKTRENRSPERSWIVCRTQYYGKLFQRPKQTESGLWNCAIEIETLVPNAAVDLPIRLQETISITSSISVSRGKILKSSTAAPDAENSESSKSDNLYWSWEKLDSQTVLQWNLQKKRWEIRLSQPGRYMIEVDFRPTIVTSDGKNEISFSILECVNSTFELLVPESVTGLEFPGVYGGVTESTPTMKIPDPSMPTQPGLKLKRVELGAVKQLVVRWNAGGFLSDGPVYDVDTMSWWNVKPDKVDVKIKYNIKVVSGSVSSLVINTDERLVLSSGGEESGNKEQETENKEPKAKNQESDTGKKEQETGNGASPETNSAPGSQNGGEANRSQSGIPFSVIFNPDNPGFITVEFDSPITSQASFELHFTWKDAVGVGRLQFPSTSVDSSRSGQRSLAFTFDPRLQYECVSESLAPMSAQSFFELWRGFQKGSANNKSLPTERSPLGTVPDSVSIDLPDQDPTVKPIPLPPPPQIVDTAPTVAYDLNLSRRKVDSSGVMDSVVMNVQRTKATSEGTAEAFVLVDYDRLLWQIKWTINITRGQCSGYSAVLPDSFGKPENHLSISSASVITFNNGKDKSFSASACIEGNELNLYWGTPVEGKCQVIVTGEIRPEFASNNPESLRTINFDFPQIKTLNVTQYKLAFGRTDNCIVKTVFDKPTSKTVVWIQAELSVETPFPSRNQRLLETWQTTINDTSKKPCALTLEIQKNEVDAVIDGSVKLVQENIPALVLTGRVKVNHGILDEFLLDVPENCYAPISPKTTLQCQQDALSITQRRYILRPLSPFASDSEFELTIPLKKSTSGIWKLEKQSAMLWSIVRSDEERQTDVEPQAEPTSAEQASSDKPAASSEEARPATSETKVFGLKMFVKPISEAEYCASAEFACAVSGVDSILVRLPEGSKMLNVQIDQRSVRWTENKSGETLIPMFTENAPVDVRIVYTSALNRTLYTDPMKFEPPTIENARQPEILWSVSPWKKLNHSDPGAVRTTSFINKQIWLINDLSSQLLYIQQTAGDISPDAAERLSVKLNEIESQLKQYEHRDEKSKTRLNLGIRNPNSDYIRRSNLTATETGAIRLAMQNVLRLREALNENPFKKDIQNRDGQKQDLNPNYSVGVQNTELFSLLSSNASPLVGTSDPGTAFVLAYSLPPAAAPSSSIWQTLSLLFIPIIIWLAFFPPEAFVLWRPAFVLGCLSVIWLLCFNLYGVAVLLFIAAVFDALNKFRQRSKPNIIPLSVR